jgi:hypothetical protein
MAEKSGEEILESWFFPAPVREGSAPLAAPEDAIRKRDELREKWLPSAPRGKNEVPEVILRPVLEGEITGWKVETAVRSKPDTTSDKTPHKNN